MENLDFEKLILEGRNKLTINGVESVDAFSEQAINLTVKGTRLKIFGEKLKISNFNKGAGSFSCDGKVSEIRYGSQKAPFIKKLFK